MKYTHQSTADDGGTIDSVFPGAPISAENVGPGLAHLRKAIDIDFLYLDKLYCHLHQHPELSFHELKTSERMATELRCIGMPVTEKVGGYGVVGVLKNGPGPTLLLRTDMDALPVTEQTGKPYASTVTMEHENGQKVGVMHACGHDMHMTVWTGTARLLAQLMDDWKGTLVFVAQPAEEHGAGAKAMLDDGLYERFPLPDYALALHVNAELPAGVLAYTPEYTFATVEILDIIVYGKGGHAAFPHTTIDPILLAARIVEALQTIRSTDLAPQEAAIITVGAIHAGTKANVVPDEVKLSLCIRSYTDKTHQVLRQSIQRICNGLAAAAGLSTDQYPQIIDRNEYAPSTYNDPSLCKEITEAHIQVFGKEQVWCIKPSMAGEDFAQYGRTKEEIPSFLYWLGAVEKGKYKAAMATGEPLPSLHNSKFIPDKEPTIKTGVLAMTSAVLRLLS